jgi:hypothetical protein
VIPLRFFFDFNCPLLLYQTAAYALDFPQRLQIVAVAEPREYRRHSFARTHK